MIGYGCIFGLGLVVQIIMSQPPPEFPPNLPPQCRGPPAAVEKPHECCKIPAFFNDEDFEECGFKKIGEDGPRPPGPPDCTKQLCMMKKYNLLKDENVDHDAVGKFLDSWAEKNANFQPTVATAKEKCLGKELPGPPHICEANKLVFCVSSTLFSECPTWEESDGCKTLKSHLEECKPFFTKP